MGSRATASLLHILTIMVLFMAVAHGAVKQNGADVLPDPNDPFSKKSSPPEPVQTLTASDEEQSEQVLVSKSTPEQLSCPGSF